MKMAMSSFPYSLVILKLNEDLALLLFDEELDNEKMDSIYINPFTDYPAEMGFYNYLELFDLIEIEEVECDDPDCDDPSHHH